MTIFGYENNQQDVLYRLIYYSMSALHVLGDVFAHHQEHLTVFTPSGSIHPSCCRLVLIIYGLILNDPSLIRAKNKLYIFDVFGSVHL
jgi:hypothetical protein